MPIIRRGGPGDLAGVAALQRLCPQAAQWPAADYLAYDLRVAFCGDRLAGFLCSRSLAAGESEILNLAVLPELRRRGIARQLVENLLATVQGPVFLEVRASNQPAIQFYNTMGFQQLSLRPAYYDNPPEAAIVMKFHSC